VLDIGGHIGSFARLCWNKGSRNIHGFEADVTNFAYYQSNAKEGVTITNKAVWRSDDDTSTLKFDTNIVDGNTGMGVISDKGTVEVEAIKLDDILSQHDKVRILKIDVEGSEYPILYTSKQLSKVDVIVGEFHEMDNALETINDYTFNRDGLAKFLEDNNFEVIKMEQASWSANCGSFKAIKNSQK
jgi:FkbM family methyltransferase